MIEDIKNVVQTAFAPERSVAEVCTSDGLGRRHEGVTAHDSAAQELQVVAEGQHGGKLTGQHTTTARDGEVGWAEVSVDVASGLVGQRDAQHLQRQPRGALLVGNTDLKEWNINI